MFSRLSYVLSALRRPPPERKRLSASTHTYSVRYQQANCWHDGQAYVAFGWNGLAHLSDVWRTLNGDPGGRFTYLPPPHWNNGHDFFVERSYVGVESFNGELHFVGGYNPASIGNVIGDHSSIGDGGRKFSQWQAPPWEAREAVGLAACSTHMMMSGGVTYLNPDEGYHLRAFDDVWKLDLNGDWSLGLSNAPWGKRRSHGWEYLDGHWWLFGGMDSQNKLKSDLWKWDGVNPPTQMPPPPWSPRGVFFSCAANGKLWIFGGFDGQNYSNNVYSYNPETDNWICHVDADWSGMTGQRALVMPGSPDVIYLVNGLGGTPSNRQWTGKVWSTTDGTTWAEETKSTLNVE